MSLYDGILDDSGRSERGSAINPYGSVWNSGIDLLKAQLKAKRLSTLNEKSGSSRQTPIAAPVIDFASRKRTRRLYDSSNGPVSFNSLTGKMEVTKDEPADRGLDGRQETLTTEARKMSEHCSTTSSSGSSRKIAENYSSPLLSTYAFMENRLCHSPYCPNEYDPMKPNDYDTIKERRRKENNDLRQRNSQQSYIDKTQSALKSGSASDPSGPSATSSTNRHSSSKDGKSTNQTGPAVASKIMAKMGYRSGQGLGKSNQGMSQALSVEKTSRRGGKIVGSLDSVAAHTDATTSSEHVDAMCADEVTTDQIASDCPYGMDMLRNPAKVVLLRNMVTHGQVDEDLESETKEECTKYGNVRKVLIFEIPDVSDEEAVRIFVEFEKIESATKAVIDLNGRYFGGRTVKACFYNLDKFRQYVLGDDV